MDTCLKSSLSSRFPCLYQKALRLCLSGINGCSLLGLADTLKAKNAVCQSVQSVITADAYVKAGVDVCAALSVKDIAGLYKLAVSSLGAQTLGIGITAVLGGAHSLFMCEELKI